MKTLVKTISIIVVGICSTLLLHAQNAIPFDVNNITEFVIYRCDTLALKENIKRIKLYYKEKGYEYKLIQDKEYDTGGRIKLVINHDYLSSDDSVKINIIESGKNIFHIQAIVSNKSINSISKLSTNSLFFPLPDYKEMIDSFPRTKMYSIDRIYKGIQDSILHLTTIVNGKALPPVYLLSPYWVYPDNDAKKLQVDTTFILDSMIITVHGMDDMGNKLTNRKSYFNNKLLKEEAFTYLDSAHINYWVANSQYDKQGRLIHYYEATRNGNEEINKIIAKEFSFEKNGFRIETIDKNPTDGKPDEIFEYDNKDHLVRWVKYFPKYDIKSSKVTYDDSEIKNTYNEKGLLTGTSLYWNGVLHTETMLKYFYF